MLLAFTVTGSERVKGFGSEMKRVGDPVKI
jgi:hypothetical protein